MALIGMRITRLVELPGTKHFHFGFAHLEPLINTVRVLIILVVASIGLISAIQALVSGGRPLSTGGAVIYGLLAAVGCLAMAFRQRAAGRTLQSPIIRVDARNWFIDGVLSSGVAVAFLIAFLLSGTKLEPVVPYIDPVLVTIMVILVLPMSARMLIENGRDVAQIAPDTDQQREIQHLIENAVGPDVAEKVVVRMLPIGRVLYLLVHVLVARSSPTRDIAALDEIRSRIEKDLSETHPRLVIDVVFTADPKRAEELT